MAPVRIKVPAPCLTRLPPVPPPSPPSLIVPVNVVELAVPTVS